MLENQESRLIRKILAHDKTALRQFYLTYSPRLLRFIRHKVGSREDIEEIAQDTLFAFLEGARDFTGRCSLSTYLCSIANYKIVDFYRKKKLKKIVFSQLPDGMETLVSELAEPEKLLDKALESQKISAIFKRLSPLYAQILRLKYVEGRSVVEIARILTISFKAAESVLFRARKAFVKLYVA